MKKQSQSTPQIAVLAPCEKKDLEIILHSSPGVNEYFMQIHPYLIFNGNCREAMLFYQSCLGGELSLQTIHDSPMAAECPEYAQEQILHATLINGQMMMMASDMGGPKQNGGNGNIFISLTCNSEEEIRSFFNNLSEGGLITRPLHEFYAGTIGALTDKFGMNWLLYL